MATSAGLSLRKHLTVTDGFVLYTSAVLGQSLIVLPSIAARHAGPWSILVWAALAAISYPVARVMAELGARYPSASGVTGFIARGLGKRVGLLTGVLYLTSVAVGAPATALFFSEYLGQLIALPSSAYLWVAGLLLVTIAAINCFDVSRIMRAQRWAFFACLAAVAAGIAFALPHGTAARLTAVRGYDLSGVAATGLICFFAFVGWENAAFAGEEFTDPQTLVKSLRAAVITVGALFLLLAVATVGSLDRGVIATSDTSLADLLRFSLGAAAGRGAAFIAVTIIFLLGITWARAISRLVLSLARDGVFPRALARIDPASGSPRPALAALVAVWLASLAIFGLSGAHIETYIQLASGNFLATYVIILIAAWRLLHERRFVVMLIVSSLAIGALVVAGWQSMWYALATAAVASLLLWARAWAKHRPRLLQS